MRICFLVLLFIATSASASELEIDVLGLFTNAAMLEINGQQRLLRKGERTEHGILLISADSREAVVEINGERVTLDLSTRIGSAFAASENAIVSIGLNNLGQYKTAGSINGNPVTFLVDTGANILALNAGDARRIGLQLSGEPTGRAVTAGGSVNSWAVVLNSVQVGDIEVSNVPAAVLEGDYPEDILLGMTFLSHVELRESAGVLVLTSKL